MSSRLSLGLITAATQLPSTHVRLTSSQAQIALSVCYEGSRRELRRSLVSTALARYIERNELWDVAFLTVNHVLNPAVIFTDIRVHQAFHLHAMGTHPEDEDQYCTPCQNAQPPIFEHCYRHPSLYNNVCANCLLQGGAELECNARVRPLQGMPIYTRYEQRVLFPITPLQTANSFDDVNPLFAELNRYVKAMYVLAETIEILERRRERVKADIAAMAKAE